MARLLRASLQGLRCSRLVSSPAPVFLRELQILRPPGARHAESQPTGKMLKSGSWATHQERSGAVRWLVVQQADKQKVASSSHLISRLWGQIKRSSQGASSMASIQNLLQVSKQIARRWYGESAVLEESCSSTQSGNDTDSASMAANAGDDSDKCNDGVEKKGVSKERSIASDLSQLEVTTKEPSSEGNSERLTSLISGKVRSKPNTRTDRMDNGAQMRLEPLSAEANTSQDESSKSVQEDKWQQVMSTIRKMALKNRSATAPGDKLGLPKRKEGENQDDFADLDLPQAGGAAGISKISNDSNRNSLAMNAFWKDYKKKDARFQSWNQPKAKEIKPASFTFPKSLGVNCATTGAETSRDKIPFDRSLGSLRDSFSSMKPKDSSCSLGSSRDSFSSMKPKDSSFHGWNQQRGKETKPVSIDFLKTPEASVASPHAEMQDRIPSNVNEVTPRASSNDISVPYSGYTVCIQNLPGHSNLALVKDALSIHGEVISSFKKPALNGSCAAYIEFKTAEAMEGALAARRLQLDSKTFTVVRADQPITTVVRLTRVTRETTESQLLSVCGRFGSLDTIRRRGSGGYDVFYKVRELPNISTILDSLNEVTLNRSRWVALPAPTLHPAVRKEVLKSSEGQAWHASQVNQMLNRIETGLEFVSVCFEDLKALTSMEDELSKK